MAFVGPACSAGSAIILVARIGEGFLRAHAQPAVRAPHVAVARLLRDGEDRPDRRPHDLRHRRDAGADLAGPRALRAEHLLVHGRGHRDPRAVVGARARRARDRAAGVLREPLVPAGVEQGLPRGPRQHLDQPQRRSRRASRACASCRRSAASGSFTERFWRTNEDQYDANMETVRISAKYFPFIEYAGRRGHRGDRRLRRLARRRAASSRSASSPRSCCTSSNVFDPINQLSQLYNTVQSAGAALHKIFDVLDTQASIRERPGAVDLAARRRDRRRRTSRSRTAPTSRCSTT